MVKNRGNGSHSVHEPFQSPAAIMDALNPFFDMIRDHIRIHACAEGFRTNILPFNLTT